MRTELMIRRVGTCLVAVGFLAQTVMGAQPIVTASQASLVRDVSLDSEQTLTGRVVDNQARPKSNVAVVIERDAQIVTKLLSDSNGQFQAGNLSAGVYRLHLNGQKHDLRVWNQTTAPPTASGIVQVSVGEIVRGQCCTPGGGCSDGCDLGGCSGGCDIGGCTGGCGSGCTGCGGGCGGGGLLGGGGLGGGGLGGGGLFGASGLGMALPAIIAAAIILPLALDDDDAS